MINAFYEVTVTFTFDHLMCPASDQNQHKGHTKHMETLAVK